MKPATGAGNTAERQALISAYGAGGYRELFGERPRDTRDHTLDAGRKHLELSSA